eukprot:1912579-Rhodomonas_salina.2
MCVCQLCVCVCVCVCVCACVCVLCVCVCAYARVCVCGWVGEGRSDGGGGAVGISKVALPEGAGLGVDDAAGGAGEALCPLLDVLGGEVVEDCVVVEELAEAGKREGGVLRLVDGEVETLDAGLDSGARLVDGLPLRRGEDALELAVEPLGARRHLLVPRLLALPLRLRRKQRSRRLQRRLQRREARVARCNGPAHALLRQALAL